MGSSVFSDVYGVNIGIAHYYVKYMTYFYVKTPIQMVYHAIYMS